MRVVVVMPYDQQWPVQYQAEHATLETVLKSVIIGAETVTYVNNIYKYYIAYRLVIDERAGKEKAVEQSTSKATSLKMPQAKSIVAPLRTEPQPFWTTTQKAAPGKNACRTTML